MLVKPKKNWTKKMYDLCVRCPLLLINKSKISKKSYEMDPISAKKDDILSDYLKTSELFFYFLTWTFRGG